MPFTDEDKQTLNTMIAEAITAAFSGEQFNKAINAAMTTRDKRLLTEVNKSIEAKWEREVEDAMNDPEYIAEQEAGAGGGGGAGDQQQPDPEKSPKFIAQQRRLEALEQEIKAERETRLAAVGKQRGDALRLRVGELLTKHGVDPTRTRHVLALLVDGEKRVKYEADDSDNLLFHDGDADLPLEDGIKGWMKTDDAKLYMPSRGLQGSGGQRAPGPRPGARPNSTIQPGEGGSLLAAALSSGFDFNAGPAPTKT